MPDLFGTQPGTIHGTWKRVLITGSRDWLGPPDVIGRALDKQLADWNLTVIHGDCPDQPGNGRSVDQLAREWAERAILFGMRSGNTIVRHERYPAYWNELGKSAGPIRNRYMVQLGADICLAFPTPSSRGTISCMDLAAAAGIPILNYGTPREGFNNVGAEVL